MPKRFLFLLAAITLLTPLLAGADSAESSLKSASPFKDFTLAQVAGGDILENRTGASQSPQIEAVQTCFLIKAPPEAVAAKILNWNPAGKSDLDVSKHLKLSGSSGPDAFAPMLETLFKGSGGDGGWLAEQSKKAKEPSCELLLTAEEKNHLAEASTPAKLTSAWAAILAHRSNTQDGPDFNHLRAALKSLGAGDIPSPSGGNRYWEIGDVSDRGSLSEGVSWSDSGSGRTRVFDGEYFVTSEYSASLNVSTLWPVTVNGKPATLVWRIDSAYANQFADQSGAERIASASLIFSSAKKTIEAIRHELEK